MNTAGNAAATYAAFRAAAHVADHIVQTSHQAAHKADAGAAGHRVMARHVGGYVSTQAVALAAAQLATGMRLRPGRLAAALAVSGATHWLIDRRWPVRKLAELTGSADFYTLGGPLGGGYHMDQALHHACEAVAALVAAGGSK